MLKALPRRRGVAGAVLASLPSTKTSFDAFAMYGGLNLHTPQQSLKPGYARDAINFDCSIDGGYSRVDGYERFDGRPRPSDAATTLLTVTIGSPLAVGNSVNGQTSGATGVVSFISGNLVGVTKLVGTFLVAENFRVGVTVIGPITEVGSAPTSLTQAAQINLASANIYRADIGAVPGSGPVRGIFKFNGTLYAFRNNAGGTAAVLHRQSSGGWVAVTMPFVVQYTGGSGGASGPAEGATLTQGGVTAVIRRVLTRTGTWGGTGVGTLVIDTIAGGSFAAGAATATGGFTLTLGGAQTQVSFLPGGRFEFDIGNAGKGIRVYGADGINKGFEFDGTYVCPISTGMTADSPSHVKIHRKYLFFSFGSSAQNSSIADPYAWTVVTGANELLVNQTINAFLVMPGDQSTAALAIIYNDGFSILYGTGASSWNLVEYNFGVGGKAHSAASISSGYMFDDLGIVSVPAVQQFGNFSTVSLTQNIRGFTSARRTLVTESLVNREKSQYRLYFSDGYGLHLTVVNRKMIGVMPILYPNPVFCACNDESSIGIETSYFGSTNGFVYQIGPGTSFDGAAIEAYFVNAFAFQGNSQTDKDYRRLALELQGDGYAQFQVGWTLSYSDPDADQPILSTTVEAEAIPVLWDDFVWDEFEWDGRVIAPAYMELEGVGENISIGVAQNSALWPSYTINSAVMHYIERRIVRK